MEQKRSETPSRGDLLLDPVISVEVDGLSTKESLPQVLALLAGEKAIEFPQLRPHQVQPWHMFVVQLAVLASQSVGRWPGTEARAWKGALMKLARDRAEVWCLLGTDATEPAFMQPATPKPDSFWKGARVDRTPDARDVLVTAKNWDVKCGAMRDADLEHWLYTLVTLQTCAGYTGARNYGVARIKSSFSMRAGVTMAPSLRWNDMVQRDVAVALEAHAGLKKEFGMQSTYPLLWSEPWDGTESLPLTSLDPLSIEVCRMVRLRRGTDGKIECWTKGTVKRRVEADKAAGVVGDPWMPTQLRDDDQKVGWGIPAQGLTYRALQHILLSDKVIPSVMQRADAQDAPACFVVVRGVARDEGDNGNTAGYHERSLPLPNDIAERWHKEGESFRKIMAIYSLEQVEAAANMRLRVLKPALCALSQGGPEKLDLNDERVSPWLAQYESKVDEQFFPTLWDNIVQKRSQGEALDHWCYLIAKSAYETLREASKRCSGGMVRKMKAESVSQAMFLALLGKNFASASARRAELRKEVA